MYFIHKHFTHWVLKAAGFHLYIIHFCPVILTFKGNPKNLHSFFFHNYSTVNNYILFQMEIFIITMLGEGQLF